MRTVAEDRDYWKGRAQEAWKREDAAAMDAVSAYLALAACAAREQQVRNLHKDEHWCETPESRHGSGGTRLAAWIHRDELCPTMLVLDGTAE